MYKIGIVGLGVIFHQYIQALAELKDAFHLVAVCDKDEAKLEQGLQRARETLKRDDIQGSTDLMKFLHAFGLNTVIIATPPSTHYPLAMKCAREKKNLLVEKPAVCHVDNLVEIHEMCSAQSLLFHTAFHSAFASDLQWFLNNRLEIERLHNLGRVIEITCGFYDPYVIGEQVIDGREELGGSYLDSGVNELSVIAQLVEIGAIRVKKHVVECLPDVNVTSKSYTELSESQGVLVVKLNTDWTLGKNEKTTLVKYDNGGLIFLNHSVQTVTLIKDDQKCLLFNNGSKPRLLTQYTNMLKDFKSNLDKHHSNYDESLRIHSLFLGSSTNYSLG